MVKTTKGGCYDRKAGQMIYYWQDCYFQEYMAASKWSYRVKLN